MRMVMSLLVAVLVSVSAGRAQDKTDIPQELLELTYQQCYQPCRGGFSHKVCDALCACSVDAFKARLDFEAYLALLQSMSEDRVSEADRIFLDNIAQQCSDALDKQGIQVGPSAREDDGLPSPPKVDPPR